MAIYTETGGNDTFVGTSGPDTFTVSKGTDSVTGGGGDDTLIVGYPDSLFFNITAGASGLSGNVQSYGSTGKVSLSGIDHIEQDFTVGGYESFTLSGTLASGNSIDFTGLAGAENTLGANLSGLTNNVTLTVNDDGSITTNLGTFTNYQEFELTLGNGTNHITLGAGNDSVTGGNGANDIVGGAGNDYLVGGSGTNTLVGGAGNDVLSSTGGKDVINGGAGTDTWYGNYAKSTIGQTLYYSSLTGAGSLTPGTTMSSIEGISFTGGSGNDVLHITGVTNGVLDGGAAPTRSRSTNPA